MSLESLQARLDARTEAFSAPPGSYDYKKARHAENELLRFAPTDLRRALQVIRKSKELLAFLNDGCLTHELSSDEWNKTMDSIGSELEQALKVFEAAP